VQTIECRVESARTSRGKELTIVLVQLLDQRVLQDSINVFVDIERQIINARCKFSCYTMREKGCQLVLNEFTSAWWKANAVSCRIRCSIEGISLRQVRDRASYSLASNAVASKFF
jgi:hypothetical protein